MTDPDPVAAARAALLRIVERMREKADEYATLAFRNRRSNIVAASVQEGTAWLLRDYANDLEAALVPSGAAPQEPENELHTGDDKLLDHISSAIAELETLREEVGQVRGEVVIESIDSALRDLAAADKLRAAELKAASPTPEPAP